MHEHWHSDLLDCCSEPALCTTLHKLEFCFRICLFLLLLEILLEHIRSFEIQNLVLLELCP